MTGQIIQWAGAATPAGYLECDGTQYATAAYPALFAVIGYTFGGAGPNFNVPDLRGRSPIGAGQQPGGTLRVLGGAGGAEDVQLSANESGLPAHDHTASQAEHDHAISVDSHYHELWGTFNVDSGTYQAVLSDSGSGITTGAAAPTGTTDAKTPAVTVNTTIAAAAASAHANMHPWLCTRFLIKT